MKKLILILVAVVTLAGCEKESVPYPAVPGRPRHSAPVKRPSTKSGDRDTTYAIPADSTQRIRRGINVVRIG